MKTLAVLLLSMTSLTSPGPGINRIKIVTRQVIGGFTDTRTEMWPEIASAMNGRHRWVTAPERRWQVLFWGERDTIFVLDLQTHEYLTYQTDSRGV